MRRRSRRMAKRAALQMHFVRRAAFCVVGEESRELKAAAVADEGARRALCGAKRLTSPFRRGALLGKLFFRENSRQVSKKLHRTALSRYNTASFVAFGNSLHVRGFQLALSSPTFLNAAFPTNSPPRRAAYGFAVCGRRRLSPPPHAAPPSRGRGGAPRSSYLAVSPSISNVIRVFSPTRTTLFSVDSSTVKLSLSQKKCDISGVLKISAPFSCERR